MLMRLIQMFEFASTPKEEKELRLVLQNYYVQKFKAGRKRVMSSGKFTATVVDNYVKTHQHGKLVE